MRAALGALWGRRRWSWRAPWSVPGRIVVRFAPILLLILALAVVGCATAGLAAAERSDLARMAAEHESLEATLGELRGLSGDSVPFRSSAAPD
jgi:hypothetical protein